MPDKRQIEITRNTRRQIHRHIEINRHTEVNPSVPGDFFLSNFLTKIGGKVHCMNRKRNLKVQSHHSFFDHARGKIKSVFQSTGGLYPQLTLSKYDLHTHTILSKKMVIFYSLPAPCLFPCLLPCPLPALLPPACSSACSTTPCLPLCLL